MNFTDILWLYSCRTKEEGNWNCTSIVTEANRQINGLDNLSRSGERMRRKRMSFFPLSERNQGSIEMMIRSRGLIHS